MSFTSLTFLFFFFPISIIVSTLAPKKIKNFVLLILSLYFYSWAKPAYMVLILLSTIVTYYGVRVMDGIRKRREETKFYMVCLIVLNVSILAFFKYYGFIIDNLNVLPMLNLSIIDLPLPFGISFYTFKVISYIVDVYKKDAKPCNSLIDCALYICIFPQIGAGPIVRYVDMEEELRDRRATFEDFGEGMEKFIIGLAKKVLIANNLALLWAQVKSIPNLEMSALTAWIGIIAFTLQIYFDFSGYSDMAIGIGRMLGFEWDENFNYPYIATSASNFWQRWHISLGRWFREYIYIPLGGNRVSNKTQVRNIFIVWMVTGLWHGASWNFIFWGIYYGVIVALEKFTWGKTLKKLPHKVKILYTLLVVVLGWVLFDLGSVSEIMKFYGNMFFVGASSITDPTGKYLFGSFWKLILIGILGSSEYGKHFIENVKSRFGKNGYISIGIYYILIFILSVASLVGSSYSPFLYFKF